MIAVLPIFYTLSKSKPVVVEEPAPWYSSPPMLIYCATALLALSLALQFHQTVRWNSNSNCPPL